VGVAADTGAVLAASSGEAIALVIAVVAATAAALSTGIGAWQGVLMKRSERNRTQPIVVVYERSGPKQSDGNLDFFCVGSQRGSGPSLQHSLWGRHRKRGKRL
jgi:hypothetical protein